MAKLVTGVIRDKSGKLVGTYQTSTGAEEVPDDVSMKFGGVTKERLDELKQNPNFHGVYPDPTKYTVERIFSIDETDYYPHEIAAGKHTADRASYQQKIDAIKQEAKERRDFEAARIETAQKRQSEIANDLSVKNRFLAHTTGNPFVAPGAREISRRRVKSAIDTFNSNQFELGEAIDSHNLLTFSSAFDTYNKEQELRQHNADHGLNTYGGYDNKYNDYSTQKLFSTAEQPVKTEAQVNQEKYNEIRPAYQDSRPGLQITGLENIPNKLTRAESQQVNKSLISAQLPHIIDNKILAQIPVEKRNAKREQINKFLSSPQVENSIIPAAYADTQTTQRVNFGSGGIDKIKEAVAKAKTVGPVTLSYVDADRKEQKVTVKNANEAVRKIYQETKNGSKEFSISASSPQGPVQQFAAPNNEVGFGIAGSLTSVFGKEQKQQGPNLNDKAFFVGANAQGYTIETKREIEPRPTATDLLGNNWYATKLDAIYEFNKPIKERSDKPRPGPLGFSNREIGEFTAPFYNRAADIADFFTKEKELDKPLGNPFAKVVTVKPTPKIETTLDKIIQGKPVDLTDKNQRISLYGSILQIAGELYALDKGVGGAVKAQTAVSNVVKATKVQKAAQLTSEGKIFGTSKLDDNTFIVTRGTEGGSLTVSEKINPLLIIDRTKDKVTSFFTKTPKEVSTLSSGEKIQKSISEIDDKIAKLKPFTDATRFDSKLVQKTNSQISGLEKQKAKLNEKLSKSAFPGEAQYPVSVIEFSNPSPAFPKGNIFTEFGKARAIENTPIGSKIIITGEVPRQNLIQLGLKQVEGKASSEFGIAQKGNPFYIGTLTEKNISKLAEAEKLGFIKSVATGKSAPLEAILKKQGDVLGEYAGVTRATTRIKQPVEENIFSWKTLSRQPEIYDPLKKVANEIKPSFTQSIDAPSKGFGAAESFGIVDSKVLPRGVTPIGSKGLDRLLPNVGLSTAKGTSKNTIKPFDFGNIKPSKGTGGSSGKAKSITVEEAKTAATNYLSTRPQATPQDILFSPPRYLPAQYHGEITDSVLAFPQGTPEKFKNQVRIDTGLELNYKLKTGQSGEGEYFNRFGLEMFKPTKKDFEKQETIPINIQTRKPDQKIRITPITGVGLTPIQTPRTGITTVQTPGLKTDLITDLTTTTITTDIPIKVPPRTGTPFEFGGFGFAFPGFGGGYDRPPRKKKYKKKYIVSSIDPLTPGSIETAGVQQQRVSSSKKIYGSLDISLGKARKKNQPKGKRSKHSIPDPF